MLAATVPCISSSIGNNLDFLGLNTGTLFGDILTIAFFAGAIAFVIGLILTAYDRIRGSGGGGRGTQAIIGGLAVLVLTMATSGILYAVGGLGSHIAVSCH